MSEILAIGLCFVPPFSLPASSIAWVAGTLMLVTTKHYLADFVLQSNWMARGKERCEGWAWPLAAHAGTHAAGMLAVALVLRPALWWLAPVDFLVHAAIDKLKTVVSSRTRWPVSDARFWWLMGADQLVHQITNIVAATILLIA